MRTWREREAASSAPCACARRRTNKELSPTRARAYPSSPRSRSFAPFDLIPIPMGRSLAPSRSPLIFPSLCPCRSLFGPGVLCTRIHIYAYLASSRYSRVFLCPSADCFRLSREHFFLPSLSLSLSLFRFFLRTRITSFLSRVCAICRFETRCRVEGTEVGIARMPRAAGIFGQLPTMLYTSISRAATAALNLKFALAATVLSSISLRFIFVGLGTRGLLKLIRVTQ